MRQTQDVVVQFDVVDPAAEQFDSVILWALVGLLAFLPASLGAYPAWAEGVGMLAACGLAIALAVKLMVRPYVRFVWSWTYLPIALFFLLIGLQLIPLPAGIVGTLSPKTLATKTHLLSDLPGAAERLKHLTLSFYPHGTWHDLRHLIVTTAVFIITVNVVRSVDQIKRLLWALVIIGTAEAILSMLQKFTGATGVYWVFDLWGQRNPDAGSFPNHNMFSQFVNLCGGAGLGLLLVILDQTFKRRDYTPAEMAEKLASPIMRWAYLLSLMLAFSISAIFLCLSRGGMVSTAIAGTIVGILLAVRGGSRGMGATGWIGGILLIIAFAIVIASGSQLVEKRVELIGNQKDQNDRLQLSKDTLDLWRDYPIFGSGLGSYRFVFPSYDHSRDPDVAGYAENEYVQLLAECGMAGAGLFALFGLMIAAAFFRARARGKRASKTDDASSAEAMEGNPVVRREGPSLESLYERQVGEKLPDFVEPFHSRSKKRRRSGSHGASSASSLAMGLAFGLMASMLQSTTDFAPHMLSVSCVLAVMCALMINLARLRRQERGLWVEKPAKLGNFSLRLTAVLVLVLISVPLLWQSGKAWAAESAWNRADVERRALDMNGWKADPGEITDLVRDVDTAASNLPDNAFYRFWREQAHWSAMDTARDPVTGTLVMTDEKRHQIADLAADINEGRWTCPTFGPPYTLLGQFEQLYLGEMAAGSSHIKTGYSLDPNDLTVCIVAAELDGDEGRWDDALRKFREAAQLSEASRVDSMALYIDYFHRPEFALDLAGDDPARLTLLASMLRQRGKPPAADPNVPTTSPATRPSDEELAQRALAKADAVIEAKADRSDAPAATLGRMGMLWMQRKEPARAVPYFSRALDLEWGQVDWRLKYAEALEACGRKEDAIHQCDIVLHQRPGLAEAKDMLNRLSPPPTPIWR